MCKVGNTFAVLAIAGLAFAAGRANLFSDASAVAQQDKGNVLKDVHNTLKSATKAVTGAANDVVGQDAASADEKMQAMMKAGTPGKFHKFLEPAIGEFDAVVRFAMEPDAPMMESKGTVKREWILDGHFLREEVDANMMEEPFHGLGFLGYNNMDGQYEFFWMDNHSTAIMMETGTYNPEKKIMTVRGSHRDPASGRLINTVGKWDMSNPDRQTMTGTAIDENGREFKHFEGVFERKKN